MRRFRTLSAVSATALVVLACNAQKPVPSKAEQTPAAAATSTASPGDAKVVGKAPAAKGGLPAVVLLHPREPREFPAQSSPPVMDQVSQSFTPSVLFVRTGQASEFRNSDDVLHNVRVRNDETKDRSLQRRDSDWRYLHVHVRTGWLLRRGLRHSPRHVCGRRVELYAVRGAGWCRWRLLAGGCGARSVHLDDLRRRSESWSGRSTSSQGRPSSGQSLTSVARRAALVAVVVGGRLAHASASG